MTNTTPFTPATTVETVFKALPDASHTFIRYKADCVGCFLARFCTLQEVADVYKLDLQSFLDDLKSGRGNGNCL